jgi:hypothetical protein
VPAKRREGIVDCPNAGVASPASGSAEIAVRKSRRVVMPVNTSVEGRVFTVSLQEAPL